MPIEELLKNFERFTGICNRIAGMVVNRYSLSWYSAQDVVDKSVVYALQTLQDPNREEAATETDFIRLVKATARLRALDEIRRIRNSPIKASVDDMVKYMENGEDAIPCENPALMRAAIIEWRNAVADSDRREKANICMRLLPRIFKAIHTSERDRKVYCAVVLENRPAKEVAKKFGITTNHLYQIVWRVGRGLAECGRGMVEAAYAA